MGVAAVALVGVLHTIVPDHRAPIALLARQKGPIALMALVFAAAKTATYLLLCVVSTAGLQRLRRGPLERHAEVVSGAFIMLVGLVFWVWPVL